MEVKLTGTELILRFSLQSGDETIPFSVSSDGILFDERPHLDDGVVAEMQSMISQTVMPGLEELIDAVAGVSFDEYQIMARDLETVADRLVAYEDTDQNVAPDSSMESWPELRDVMI